MPTTYSDVKKIIFDVSGLDGSPDNILDSSSLSDLGFQNNMCCDLAGRLDEYVKPYNPHSGVSDDEINRNQLVQGVINMVNHKIQQ